MMRKVVSMFALAGILASGVASPVLAFSDSEKKEIETILQEYLLANPEILVEVQKRLEDKREAARQEQATKAVSTNHDQIFNSKNDIVLGNPAGKYTVVEFFDYNCGYCKGALADMDAVISSNPDVKFVLKEFPILGEDSVAAHKVADAFRLIAPEKYGDFHRALLTGQHADEAIAIGIAKDLGVTEEALRAKMASDSHDDRVRDTYRLAQELGITGTPSYVVGNEAVFGAIGAEALTQKVANLGQCGKTTC